MCYTSSRCLINHIVFFFFKQNTAYELRIRDWSSDVCSSDLVPGCDAPLMRARNGDGDAAVFQPVGIIARPCRGPAFRGEETPRLYEIGRASCRERVCRYV